MTNNMIEEWCKFCRNIIFQDTALITKVDVEPQFAIDIKIRMIPKRGTALR